MTEEPRRSYPTDARALYRALGPSVYGPTMLEGAARFGLLPVIPLLALHLGFDVTGAAAVSVIPGFLAVAGPVPAGRIITAFGGRRALTVSGMALVVVYCAALFALRPVMDPTVTPDAAHQVILLVTVLISAMVSQIWVMGRQSFLGSELPAPLRARGMAYFGGSLRVGQVIGPLLSAGVLAFASFAWVFALSAVLTAIATAGVALFMVPGERRGAVPGRSPKRSRSVSGSAARAANSRSSAQRALDAKVIRRMVVVGAGAAPIMMGRVVRPVVVPLVGAVIGVEASVVSIVFGISAVLEIAMVIPAGRVMERYGRTAIVLICAAFLGTGFMALGIAGILLHDMGPTTALLVLLVPSLLMALGNGMGAGIMMTLGVDLSPHIDRTRYLAWWNTMLGAGQLLSPLLVTAVTAVAPVAWTAVAIAAVVLGGGAWAAATMPALLPSPGDVDAQVPPRAKVAKAPPWGRDEQ